VRTNVYDNTDIPKGAQLTVLGNANAFSGQCSAMIARYADEMKIQYVKNMRQIHAAIRKGGYGLLPLINFSSSPVDRNINALRRIPNLRIVGDATLEVKMAAIGTSDCDLNQVIQVQSHEQALLQCEDFIMEQLPEDVMELQMASTSEAVKQLLEKPDPRVLALASADTNLKGTPLHVLRDKVSNAELIGEQNATGFVIGHANSEKPDILPDKSRHLCIVTPANVPKMLKHMTSILGDNGADLSMLVSRPIGVGKYSFIIEFQHNGNDPALRSKELGNIRTQLSALPPGSDRIPVLQSLGSWDTSIWDPRLKEMQQPLIQIPEHLRAAS
jgi:prephenate dehydratase